MVEFGGDVLLIELVDELGVGLQQGNHGEDELVVAVYILHVVFDLQEKPL